MPNNFRSYAARTYPLEKRYTPAIERIIKNYRKQFVAAYKQSPQAARQHLERQVMNEDILKVLTDIYKVAGLSGAKAQHSELKKAATQKAGGFGRNETWIANVIRYLRLHGLRMVSAITETMREDILKILEIATNEGWSIDDTVKQLLTHRIESRARVIARTEINRASNVGHAIGAQSAPYEVNKKWLSGLDHRVRHSHKLVNRHVVDENGYFDVQTKDGGVEQMLYPGDPSASAGNTVNCRCRVIYEPKRDTAGRLIMRNPNQAPVVPMRRPQQLPLTGIAAVLKSNITVTQK